MRVAVVQSNPAFGEVERNIRDAVALIESASADLYVLPELFNTGYNFVDRNEVERLAEAADGNTFRELSRVAQTKACHIAYGFAERADRLYNSSAIVGPRGLAGVYRKVHLFFRENLFFAPGNLGFPVFELPFGRVGMMICFDWIYPESARSLALGGAEIILHPSNLVLPHCPDAMITRCLENRVFAATANRIGREDRGGVDLSYIGKSEIVSPRGEILDRRNSDETGIGIAEIDLTVARNKRLNEYNDLLRGRRGDQYRLG